MRAHLVQLDIAWEDREANFARTDELISRTTVAPGDLVLLPEMFDSGFSLNTSKTADQDGASAGYLAQLARRLGAFVQGGVTAAETGEEKARNRALVFSPEGREAARYDKVHPFSFGREPEAFASGEELTTYWWGGSADEEAGGDGQGLRVFPAICYDLRFPELFRAGLSLGAECMAIGANWPSARAEHWRALLIARAIENQAFVLGVNRAGADPHLEYAGGSIAVSPRGEVLIEAGAEEGVFSVEIDASEVRAWRKEFGAWRDRKSWLGPEGESGPSGG